MIVTGVQPAGSRGVSTLQAATVDTKEVARIAGDAQSEGERGGFNVRAGEPQPVVFPRDGLPMDQRPVSHRMQQAAARYEQDGGAERDERNSDDF
jgi:hypothetical protein